MRRWVRAALPGWRGEDHGVWFAPNAIERILEPTAVDAMKQCEVRLKSGELYDLAMTAHEVAAIIEQEFKRP